MKNICNYELYELEKELELLGGKKYNAASIFDFVYKKDELNIDNFTNIKKEIREELKKEFSIIEIKELKKEESTDTIKFLFELNDKNTIEAVLMKHNYGNSLCVSSQVGCNMSCLFCESGKLKKVRDLKAYEIVNQILIVNKYLKEKKERVSHVVVMGIGEPFDNYENVMKMIKVINHPKGLEIGARHITISTCGILSGIDKLMHEPYQVNLAISLHASNDEIRNKLMPINKVTNIRDLLNKVDEYIEKTNRRVTIEYIMLENINDKKEHAFELSKLLKGKNIYINLIPYNETSNKELKASKKEKILEFYDILKKNKLNVTIRREFGSEITGACGQLRATYGEETK